jgi:nicotinate-nucleotide adenylyltransferase
VHIGHIAVGESLATQFALDEFVFVPAFHAPHKPDRKPTSEYHRHAMLALATAHMPQLFVSLMELELREKRYTVDTLAYLASAYPDDETYFVMGADSWMDIRSWREWEKVLKMANHIVVTRPGYAIDLGHVTEQIRSSIVDLRGGSETPQTGRRSPSIYLSDTVQIEASATAIRRMARAGDAEWRTKVPEEVANYIEKYQIYT